MVAGGQERMGEKKVSEKERWEKKYRDKGVLWGEDPSVLAIAAIRFLKKLPDRKTGRSLADLGCGYGRDLVFLAKELPDIVLLGIDSSRSAAESATRRCLERGISNITIKCVDFREIQGQKFDIVYSSNLYHLLSRPEREEFCSVVSHMLMPGGYLFLSTLSDKDPEHAGKGEVVRDDPGSFMFTNEDLWLHFASREELSAKFGSLRILSLSEIAYTEPRVGGNHHHISWILIGQRKS